MKFVVYHDAGKGWRWRLLAANGWIVADSGEGYATRSNAVRAVRTFKREAWRAGIE